MTTLFDRFLLSGTAALATTLLVSGCTPGTGPAAYEGEGTAGTPAGTAPEAGATPGTTPRAQAPSPTPTPSPTPSPASVPGIDLSAHSATDPASPWVVVNKRKPLDPVDYEPELTVVRGYLVRPEVASDLTAFLDTADDDGVHMTLRSAYRGYAKQAQVYDGWVAQLGRAEADEVSARPGHSEHQTGLAVDVGSSTRPDCDFDGCFGETAEGRWAAEHAAEFGFLVRYTPENSRVTGYGPEPWHLRWVGRDLAGHMRDTGVTTLEEVFDVPGGGYAR